MITPLNKHLKKALYDQCETFVNQRLQTIETIISSNQKALQSETKSSAGDKHETGRAMLQLEMEKAGQQLSTITQMKETIAKINPAKTTDTVRLGSLVFTNNRNYFIAISAGKIAVDNQVYFAVSPGSPIGKLFLGKQKGAMLIFNKLQIKIKNVM
ncbi:MAG: 3-oxoacyl-ACP synthase [Polaribacter sp.]|nr:3-oxoacyl-ACP synthase [Polaribacter sp.]